MKRNILLCLLIIILLVTLLKGISRSTITGRDIMNKVFNREEGQMVNMEVEMTLINRKNHQRKRTIKVLLKYYGSDKKSLFYFKYPANVKGVKFLSHDYTDPRKEDERWLYFPSLKRVKRISGSSKNDYFMGSDLTYNDLRKRNVDEAAHKLLREEERYGYVLWVVESIPRRGYDIYSKQISYIRKDALIPIKVDFYDKRGAIIKIMRVLKLEKIDDIWVVKKLEMENIQKKHKTLLEIKKISFKKEIKDRVFLPSQLDRVRIN